MILCVSPNTNIERTWSVPGFRLGGVFRVREEIALASGKGINVARGIHTLGKESMGMGFVAGHGGRLFAALAEREGIQSVWTWVEGEERETVAVVDPESTGDATLISNPGPQVGPEAWQRLKADVMRQAVGANLVCFSGSLPPDSPLPAFTELIQSLQAREKLVWVDCQGGPLQAALQARPAGVKVNAHEASEITGLPVGDTASAYRAALALCELGAGQAIVTLGRAGAVLVAEGSAWQAAPPFLAEFRSSVGSGDAFLAGWLASLEDGLPPELAFRSATAAGAANTLSLGGGRFTLDAYHLALEQVVIRRLY